MLSNLLRRSKLWSVLYQTSRYENSGLAADKHNQINHVTTFRECNEAEPNTLPSTEIIEPVVPFENKSVLEKCEEDISHIAPYLKPTFNFAAYVNKSHTLQELVKLGVDLHKLEKKQNVPSFILNLDFEKDMKDHIVFLHDHGLSVEDISNTITKNPLIFKEELENLKTRVNYLRSKRFTDKMITRILTVNPYWLMFTIKRIDTRLGFFQKNFFLTGPEVRTLSTKHPRIITYNLTHVRTNIFSLKEEMGFSKTDTKQLLLRVPRLFTKDHNAILKTFEYLHNTMMIPLDTIMQRPEVLTCRENRLKQRHQFLEKLGRLQFDPKKPNYIAPITIASGTDSYFATEIAKSSAQAFNQFLKTL